MSFDFYCLPEHILEGKPVAIFKFVALVIVAILAFMLLRKLLKSMLFRAVIIVLGALFIYGGITSETFRDRISDTVSNMWDNVTEEYEDFKD